MSKNDDELTDLLDIDTNGSDTMKSDGRTVLLRSVLPAAVALIFGLIIGLLGQAAAQKPPAGPAVVAGISDNYSVLDSLRNVKDDQIAALNSQIAALSTSTSAQGTAEVPTISAVTIALTKKAGVAPALDVLLRLPPALSAGEKTVRQGDLKSYMVSTQAWEKTAQLFEKYPSADTKTEGRMSGDVVLAVQAIYKDGTAVYRADTSFATMESVTNVTYVAAADKSGRLISLYYVGTGSKVTPETLAAAYAKAAQDAKAFADGPH